VHQILMGRMYATVVAVSSVLTMMHPVHPSRLLPTAHLLQRDVCSVLMTLTALMACVLLKIPV
jgi:hypothetical protein